MININITGEKGMIGLATKFAEKVTPNALSRIAAASGVYVWKEHLRQFYTPKKNKLGGVSTGYWRDTHDSIVATRTNSQVTITAKNKGLRQHYYGNPNLRAKHVSEVTGKTNRFLTVPVHPKAHSKTIKDLGGIKKFYIVPFYGGGFGGMAGGAGVFYRSGGRTSGRRGRDQLYYVLKRKVVIKPDLNIIPKAQLIADEMRKRLAAQTT